MGALFLLRPDGTLAPVGGGGGAEFFNLGNELTNPRVEIGFTTAGSSHGGIGFDFRTPFKHPPVVMVTSRQGWPFMVVAVTRTSETGCLIDMIDVRAPGTRRTDNTAVSYMAIGEGH